MKGSFYLKSYNLFVYINLTKKNEVNKVDEKHITAHSHTNFYNPPKRKQQKNR